jgi:NADH/NAD ratio-sensing transcriptional regulator Rex
MFWDREVVDESVEELAVVTNELWELSAAVQFMQQSARTIKILTVPTQHVHKTAEVFRRIGIQGVVRDPMGVIVVPIAVTD